MRESVGYVFTINIMIVFILVTFVFIAGTLSYNRGYKASSRIINAIEKNEGYNQFAIDQINRDLGTIGYNAGQPEKCIDTITSNGMTGTLVSTNERRYNYCVYFFDVDGDSNHYSYSTKVYMTVDFTMFGYKLKLPLYVKSNRLYHFR